MKRSGRSWLIFNCVVSLVVFSSSAFAQTDRSGIPTHVRTTTYQVTLTATPANQVAFGNPVTLTARVMEIPPNTAVSGAVLVPNLRLRFTFKVKMTSPCAGMNPITIASTGPVATWSASKGGNYTVSVHVTPANTLFPVGTRLPDVVGDATLNYVVTGGPATPNLPYVTIISTPVVPASGTATAPADVTMTANWNTPSYPAIYNLTVGCETAGGTAPSCPAKTTGYISPTLPITLPTLHLTTSGQYLLYLSGTMIRQSDCTVTGVVYTHVTYVLH